MICDKVTIINDDCATFFETCADQTFDVVVTSPPYNIGLKYNQYQDDIPRADYLHWLSGIGQQIKRVLKPNGSFFLNVGSKPTDPWVAFDVAQAMRHHFQLQNQIHWVKAIAITDDLAPGHYKPISGKRFLNDCHEFVFHFTESGSVPLDRMAIGVPYQYKRNIGRYNDHDKRDRGNTWFVPYPTKANNQKRKHPATFPVALAEMCIKLHGITPDMHVLDPFFGAGNTGIACQNLNVACTGVELDPDYYSLAVDLLQAHGDRMAQRDSAKTLFEECAI
jgi:site-specific DNA-methyltransferase (adenine-specific)